MEKKLEKTIKTLIIFLNGSHQTMFKNTKTDQAELEVEKVSKIDTGAIIV